MISWRNHETLLPLGCAGASLMLLVPTPLEFAGIGEETTSEPTSEAHSLAGWDSFFN